MPRRNTITVRLTDRAAANLEELVKRWEMSASEIIQSVIVQLARRKDLQLITDVGAAAKGNVDVLVRCRDELNRAIEEMA